MKHTPGIPLSIKLIHNTLQNCQAESKVEINAIGVRLASSYSQC
jgi:hypothetical protein